MPVMSKPDKTAWEKAVQFRAELGKEIIIKTVNEIGVLADVAKIVAERGVGILAISSWTEGVNGIIHLVTDDNLRAKEALERKGFELREGRVILVEVPHKPGMLKHISEQLRSAEVDIHHIYGSAMLDDEKCLIVFASADNDRALVAIRQP